MFKQAFFAEAGDLVFGVFDVFLTFFCKYAGMSRELNIGKARR